ncbi:MAG: hypothetical protein Q9212_005771 [Teloschistes hypoglaucus]
MQYFTILAILFTPLFQLVVSQTIDPSTVDDATKQKWCNDQQAACPLLCLQMNATDVPASNDCTPAQNPTRVNTSTISTMSATATSGSSGTKETGASAVYTGFGAASTTGSSSGKSEAQTLIIGFGRSYGLAIVFIGVSAAFTFFL